jgi:maleylacetoacetate isomerase
VTLLFHGYFRSSASFRVRIAFNLKGIEPENAYHHLRRNEHRTPEYLALNPQGLMPALEVDGAVLTQSLAILEYIDERWPEPPLLPADALGRARVRGLAELVACDIHPIDNLRVLRYLRTELGQDEPTVQAWYNYWIAEGFASLETMLATSPQTGRFCHGDTPTLADLCLIPQVVNSKNFGLDLTPYPTIRRIYDACLAMPAFEAAMPGNQPDKDPA